jgi:hypothetical protein
MRTEGRTQGNHVLIKLDQENNSVRLKSGLELFVDTTYEVEKHITVTGEVMALPSKLYYSGRPNIGMPWETEMELKIGDRVFMYYLSVANAFRKETFNAIVEEDARYVFIKYQYIFAAIRDGKLFPINGYLLVEPSEDPDWLVLKEKLGKAGLQPVKLKNFTNTDVNYGIVRYIGNPVLEYVDKYSDRGVNVGVGDIVVTRRITDIPLEYDLHAKADGGKKYWRIQRKNILAVLKP